MHAYIHTYIHTCIHAYAYTIVGKVDEMKDSTCKQGHGQQSTEKHKEIEISIVALAHTVSHPGAMMVKVFLFLKKE